MKGKWKVVVDVFSNVIRGTNGCHKFVWDRYNTKKKAQKMADAINAVPANAKAGYAWVEKE
jgi:hypothetical protein